MKEKKILFKYENGKKFYDIKNINQDELLEFICEILENLIENNIVSRDAMLTCINLCLTVGSVINLDDVDDKQLKELTDKVIQNIHMFSDFLYEAKNNKR